MLQSRVEPTPPLEKAPVENANGARSGTLAVASIAGLLASACCIGPFVLASIGLGAVAGGIMAVLEPLRPGFIVIALAALGFAGWKIHRRPVGECEAGTVCAVPQSDRTYRTVFWIVAAIVLALLAFPYYLPLVS